MTLTVTPHLNFRGQARAALEFYKQVFDAEQVLVTYGDFGQAETPEDADRLIWGQVASAGGFRIMAFDILSARPHDPGVNAFFVVLRGSSIEEIRLRWERLADGATVQQALAPAIWSPLYGMLTDRFGVTWVVDVENPKAQSLVPRES